MKKANFSLNVPAVWQSFSAFQDAVSEAVKALATPFGNSIVNGCIIGEWDGDSFPISEGLVLLEGEVLRMPEQEFSLVEEGSFPVVYKTTIALSNYPVSNYNDTIKGMVTETIALVKYVLEAGVGEVPYGDMIRIDDKLSKLLGGKWTQVTPSEDCDLEIGIEGNDANFMSFINEGRDVTTRGSIRIVGSFAIDATKTLFTYPAGSRPLITGNTPFIEVMDSSFRKYLMRISTAGVVQIINKTGVVVNNAVIQLNDFRFRIDI